MPKAKRSARNVKGGACCRPIFVAMKPLPQTETKYHASAESKRLVDDFCNEAEIPARAAAEKSVSIRDRRCGSYRWWKAYRMAAFVVAALPRTREVIGCSGD